MIQEIAYAGWKRNLRLQGPTTELIITLEVGPRIIRYAHHDAKNVFIELPEQMGGSGEKEWTIRGGHRFWTAPEAEHSYDLDNAPVQWKIIADNEVEVTQPPSDRFGFQKSLRVAVLKDEVIRVTHLLTNISKDHLAVTPWALSVMAPGGMAIVPQPPRDLHPSEFPEGRATEPQHFLPDRELILWPYTDLTDGRYIFSEHFLRLSYHPDRPATKLGLKFSGGWVAYQNGEYVFAKHFGYDPALPYPDGGANLELFTNRSILEVESLASNFPLEPGATREHVEHWVLRKVSTDLREEKAACDFFASLPAIS
jgi:hypothetical protein